VLLPNLDAVTKFFVDCCLPLVVPAATADAAGVVDDASWWCCCVVFNNNDDDDDDDDGGDGDNASDDLWAWFSIFLCCRAFIMVSKKQSKGIINHKIICYNDEGGRERERQYIIQMAIFL
jgi:hypothetical protein